MLSALMTLALLGAEPPSAADEGSAAPITQPAPPSAADSIVAAAFKKDIGTAQTKLQPPGEISANSMMVPGLALLGLAAVAFTVSRRKKASGTSIRVLESASLGPKRNLIIAEVMGERLVLGVSEAGITVLSSKPAPVLETGFFEPVVSEPVLRTATTPQMGFFDRLRGKSPSANFEASLNESIEDQELRAKLAAGMRGVVP